jgi:glucose/arabinose dehydrogenase
MPSRTSFAAALLLLPALLAAGSSSNPKAVFTPAGTFPGVVLQQVATSLGPLTSITHAGDDRVFLTRRNGLVLILENGAVRPEPFLDLSALTTTEGERGLLSIAFHPRYAENGLFFVDYTDLQGNIVIARYKVSAADPNEADPASAAVLLTIPKTTEQHNGGQLQFGPDGYLYISVGDNAGRTPAEACSAQEGGLLGKILRLDVDNGAGAPPHYSIPADNPYVNTSPLRDEIWASGLRNPWRFSFDRLTGDLWIADVGATEREEINFQPAGSPGGQNYGWKIMEGSLCFRANNCPATVPPCESPLFTPPVLEYSHDGDPCSVTGGSVYRGTALPQIHGAYVFGDFCSGQIWAADRRGTGFRVREVSATAPLLTAFGEDRNGELYLATISGILYRLASRSPVDTAGVYDPALATFFFRNLHTLGGAADRTLVFSPSGSGGALPVAGDWNGDGKTTVGLWIPDTGRFLLKNTLLQGRQDVNFVLPVRRGMVPLAGDWNGDGRDSVGLYDPSTGTFQLKNALAAGKFDVTWRFPGSRSTWLPVAGDWNGDGRDTVGLYDPVTSTFYLKNTFQGLRVDVTVQFGPANSGWAPLAGDWDGDGRDTVGFYDPETGLFRLKNNLRGGGLPEWTYAIRSGGGGMAVVGEW